MAKLPITYEVKITVNATIVLVNHILPLKHPNFSISCSSRFFATIHRKRPPMRDKLQQQSLWIAINVLRPLSCNKFRIYRFKILTTSWETTCLQYKKYRK